MELDTDIDTIKITLTAEYPSNELYPNKLYNYIFDSSQSLVFVIPYTDIQFYRTPQLPGNTTFELNSPYDSEMANGNETNTNNSGVVVAFKNFRNISGLLNVPMAQEGSFNTTTTIFLAWC